MEFFKNFAFVFFGLWIAAFIAGIFTYLSTNHPLLAVTCLFAVIALFFSFLKLFVEGLYK